MATGYETDVVPVAGANNYPIYEVLPDGGYKYDTTYLGQHGEDPYVMPNGIRGDFGDQEAYYNLRNRAEAAQARYEQSRGATLQGQATSDLMQVQADPETHALATSYMQNMGLNAQEAFNLATTERAQALGVWGAAAVSYAPTQQALDTAQWRNTSAGLYYGADAPYMSSEKGYGAHIGVNSVSYNDDGTVNVMMPNGQVVNNVDPNLPYASAMAGSVPGAMQTRAAYQAAVQKALNASYGQTGAPTNAQVESDVKAAVKEHEKMQKDAKKPSSSSPL